MSKFLLVTLLLICSSTYACDKWTDKKTGKTYVSGSPKDCPGAYRTSHNSKVSLRLNDYINKRVELLNIIVKVNGRVKAPNPCPVCPKGSLCKPCYSNYIFFESNDKKERISINLKPMSHFLKSIKPGSIQYIYIKYQASIGSGIVDKYGVFILVELKWFLKPITERNTTVS